MSWGRGEYILWYMFSLSLISKLSLWGAGTICGRCNSGSHQGRSNSKSIADSHGLQCALDLDLWGRDLQKDQLLEWLLPAFHQAGTNFFNSRGLCFSRVPSFCLHMCFGQMALDSCLWELRPQEERKGDGRFHLCQEKVLDDFIFCCPTSLWVHQSAELSIGISWNALLSVSLPPHISLQYLLLSEEQANYSWEAYHFGLIS